MSKGNPKVSFRLPQDLLDDVDAQIKKGAYYDRSDFFRSATIQQLGKGRNIIVKMTIPKNKEEKP